MKRDDRDDSAVGRWSAGEVATTRPSDGVLLRHHGARGFRMLGAVALSACQLRSAFLRSASQRLLQRCSVVFGFAVSACHSSWESLSSQSWSVATHLPVVV